jgi:membrane protein implicated in regulation of membrane protease activity
MSFALGSLALLGGVALILVAEEASAVVVVAVVLGSLAISATAFFALRRWIATALAAKPTSGREALVGNDAVVSSVSGSDTQVFLDGSLWKALAPDAELQKGDHVVVESVDGLTLKVHKAEEVVA